MKPIIICITPVKNEAWVLERFLKATSLWADYIIIADQMSTDGSREIAQKFEKVILVDNPSIIFNELQRKKLLINEARKIKGPKLLITLDADEMFSPEIFTNGEWENVLKLKPGTAVEFQWANFSPDLKHMWMGYFFPWGYMDDGNENYDIGITDNAIHCARVPINENTNFYRVNSFSVIHFQYTDWNRMVHKHYYYQCLEVIKDATRSAVDIYRQYHHMYEKSKNKLILIPEEWIGYYEKKNINILEVNIDERYWYDDKVIEFFDLYGVSKFKKIYIWEFNWAKSFKNYHYKDPRNFFDKIIHFWLFKTQNFIAFINVRRIDKFLKYVFAY